MIRKNIYICILLLQGLVSKPSVANILENCRSVHEVETNILSAFPIQRL